jgi:hypothetical protein
MLTLGYRKEKNKFVDEPKMAKIMESVHMRGVFMDSETSSVGRTDART